MSLYDDSRAAWGAAKSTNPVPVAPGVRVGVSWHYPGGASAITPASPHSSCLSQVKAWQTFHMTDRGWADIGYNLLICQHARVIEGRGADLVGAHSPGVNREHYGVQLMVSGTASPTPAMYARAVQLRADLEARSGRRLRQWGHQDDPAAATECPGAAIEAWVKAGGPYASTTPTDPSTDPREDTMTPDELWGADIIPAPDEDKANPTWTPASYLRWIFRQSRQNGAESKARDAALTAKVAELATAVQQLRAEQLDAAAVSAASKAGAGEALRELITGAEVTLTAAPEAVSS